MPKIKSAVPKNLLPMELGLQGMDSNGLAALSLKTGMHNAERIKYAEQRIKELKLLIHHWEKNEKQKQIPETRPMS